jgi:hypothetical protein
MSQIALPSDAEIAALCNGIYDYPGFAPVVWDHLELPEQDGGICWALKRLGAVDVIVLRGSTTPGDWLRDFDAVADPFIHSDLGPVHPGFLAGMEKAWQAMQPLCGSFAGDLSQQRDRNVIVTGHSLGAGRAAILTGLMVHAAKSHQAVAPLARVVFGEPRPGFPQLARLIGSVSARSYRNSNGSAYDLVTDVPIALGLEDYVHPCSLSDVCEAPGPNWTKQWGPFAWHAMPLYLAALEKQEGLPPSGPVDAALQVSRAPSLPIH